MIDVTLSMPRKNRVQIVAKRGEDPVLLETAGQGDGKAWERIGKSLGIEIPFLLGRVLATTPAQAITFQIEDPATRKPPDEIFYVRRMESPRTSATKVGTFDEALATPGEIIEWESAEATCCLDIDYHGTKTPPSAIWLEMAMNAIQPRPTHWWISRGGGLHLVYQRFGHLAANELAAIGGMSWLHLDRLAGIELLRNTRMPPTGSTVYRPTPTGDLGAVAKLFGRVVDQRLVDEWLDARGLVMGQSYEHSQCPVWPLEQAGGRPMFVGEGGIICKRCEAGGKTYGSRKPGYFPYTALVGGGPSNVFRTMAARFCHWEHARIVLEDRLGLTGEPARLAWQAMLHLLHGDDPRVERAMSGGRNLIRLDRRWATKDANSTYTKDIGPMISALPACQNAEGQPIPETVTRFLQPIDLDEEGYPAITPIPGIRIYSHYMPLDEGRIVAIVPSPELRAPHLADRRPRYLPESQRLNVDQCFQILEEPFPGIDRNYLLLLLAAKGITEGRIGLPPNIMVAGVTSSGKTNTAHVAAAIAGDRCADVVWQQNLERFRQAYHTAAEMGSYVCISEILKDADRQGSTAVQALDVFLNLTPDSLSHKLYTGAVPLGKMPTTIVTDIEMPQSLRNDQQIARRFIYLRLGGRVDWLKSLVETGVYEAKRLRLADEKYCDAANGLLSYVIDKFFREPTTLVDISRKLGYDTLDNAKGFDNPGDTLRRFYDLVRLRSESTERRWQGGWKVIRRGEEGELTECWELLCDGMSGAQWGTSRRIAAEDWSKVLGVEYPVKCEVRPHGATVGVRFLEERPNDTTRVSELDSLIGDVS